MEKKRSNRSSSSGCACEKKKALKKNALKKKALESLVLQRLRLFKVRPLSRALRRLFVEP
jgi:hypothetical protein